MTFAQLQALREGGFNRISMGVQSASDRELQTLGRRHSFAQAQQSVQMAQAAGFQNVSVDLMLGTPGRPRRPSTALSRPLTYWGCSTSPATF